MIQKGWIRPSGRAWWLLGVPPASHPRGARERGGDWEGVVSLASSRRLRTEQLAYNEERLTLGGGNSVFVGMHQRLARGATVSRVQHILRHLHV